MREPTAINNYKKVIDSRDVIARIEYLEEEIEDSTLIGKTEELPYGRYRAVVVVVPGDTVWHSEETYADEADAEEAAEKKAKELTTQLLEEDYSEELAELATLKALAEEGSDCSAEWDYGATLIRDSYFVEYCKDMLVDIGDLPKNLPHYIEIDWDKTADNLKADYASVDFDGVEYFVR